MRIFFTKGRTTKYKTNVEIKLELNLRAISIGLRANRSKMFINVFTNTLSHDRHSNDRIMTFSAHSLRTQQPEHLKLVNPKGSLWIPC